MPATGPVSKAGKAASSRNAVKHGILSEAVLVTPQETEQDWQSHLSAVRENLAPRDHLETCLAERVALLLWRMRRLACAEVEAITWSQQRVVNDYPKEEFDGKHPSPVHEHAERLQEAMRWLDLWNSVSTIPDGQWLDSSSAAVLVRQAMRVAGMREGQAPPGLPLFGEWTREVWTGGRLRACLAWIVTERGLDRDQFDSRCRAHLEERVKQAQDRVETVHGDLQRMTRRRMLPPETEMQLQSRYEAHLGRELSRTLKALRDLRSRPGPAEERLEVRQSASGSPPSPVGNGGSEERSLQGSVPLPVDRNGDGRPKAAVGAGAQVEPTAVPAVAAAGMSPQEPVASRHPARARKAENCGTNSPVPLQAAPDSRGSGAIRREEHMPSRPASGASRPPVAGDRAGKHSRERPAGCQYIEIIVPPRRAPE